MKRILTVFDSRKLKIDSSCSVYNLYWIFFLQSDLSIVNDAGTTLNNFCAWQSGWNPTEDSNPEHADYVALLTKVDIELRGQRSVAGLGRAGMCGLRTKCSITEDNGLSSGFVMAHETGHV